MQTRTARSCFLPKRFWICTATFCSTPFSTTRRLVSLQSCLAFSPNITRLNHTQRSLHTSIIPLRSNTMNQAAEQADAKRPTSWDENKDTMLPRCILPLSSSSHKGSSGRIGVLGGSALYTGAPYYAASAALQTGADLVTIWTAAEACTPLKCYSPELMVHGVYKAEDFDNALMDLGDVSVDGMEAVLANRRELQLLVDKMIQTVASALPRLHALIVGPGLGRCPVVGYAVGKILQHVRQNHPFIPVILDADALYHVGSSELWREGVCKGNPQIILTPNKMETQRLSEAVDNHDWVASVTIVRKGAVDQISRGLGANSGTMECTERGALKRSGGVGDILAGTMGTLAAWQFLLNKENVSWIPAGWTACHLVKRSTEQAWKNKKRAMTAPDVLNCLGFVFDELIGQDYNEKRA